MFIVFVHVHVKPECTAGFRAASAVNAQSSLQEPGVIRFDVVQEQERPERFVLVEVYRTPADAAAHKETAHYATWRDAVAEMMAEPRRSTRYEAAYPDTEAQWTSRAE